MLKSIVCIAFATALFCSQGFSQSADGTSSTKDKNMFASNECIAKGGIGILVKNLYVDLKSGKNELVLGGGSRWTGKDAPSQEVVIFFQGRIWSPQSLPSEFDLSKTIVISFEEDKVRFFDFGKMSGGYYRRRGS